MLYPGADKIVTTSILLLIAKAMAKFSFLSLRFLAFAATLLLVSHVAIADEGDAAVATDEQEVAAAEATITSEGETVIATPDEPEPEAEASEQEAEAEASEGEEGGADVSETAEAEPEDPKCPSRPHIIRCAAHHLDVNKNNHLERKELDDAISALPWYSRGLLKILGSVDSIMKKCDADGDDAISIDKDMEATKDVCLATCFKRKAFKGAFFPDCDL